MSGRKKLFVFPSVTVLSQRLSLMLVIVSRGRGLFTLYGFMFRMDDRFVCVCVSVCVSECRVYVCGVCVCVCVCVCCSFLSTHRFLSSICIVCIGCPN